MTSIRKNTKHFKAESLLDLLFIIMKIPKNIHTSNVDTIVSNDEYLKIGTIAIKAVYIPATIANMINFFQVKSTPPNNFFTISHSFRLLFYYYNNLLVNLL